MAISDKNKIEFDKMIMIAQDILLDYGCYDFPIDVFALADKIGIKTIPYSALQDWQVEALTKTGVTHGFLIPLKEPEDGKYHFHAYYDDINDGEAICRFTIAHEIKHAVMGDVFDHETAVVQNNEMLADYFAKSLLAPQSIIVYYKIRSPRRYMEIFGLDEERANRWFINMQKRKCRFGDDHLFDYEQNFIDELITRKNQRQSDIN